MPIVVKHEPSAAAVLGMSRIAGEGAFNKWKTEFEARQKQYAFQNLMSGISGGMGLAQPFIQASQQQAGRDHQMAMYEKAQGDKLVQDQKAMKGLVPSFLSIFGPGGHQEFQPDGSRTIPPKQFQALIDAGDPAGLKRWVDAGMAAQRATGMAMAATDPYLARRKSDSEVEGTFAARNKRVTKEQEMFQQLLENPDNPPLTQERPGGPYKSPDPNFERSVNDHARKIRSMKLGVRELGPKGAVEAYTTPEIGPDGKWTGSYWSQKGAPTLQRGGAATGTGGRGAAAPLLPPAGTPAEDWTVKQKEYFLKGLKEREEHERTIHKPDPQEVARIDEELNKLRTDLRVEENKFDKEGATEGQKAEAQKAIARIEKKQAAALGRMPKRPREDVITQRAEEWMFRRHGLPPFYDPEWQPRPSVTPPRGFQTREQEERRQAFMDYPYAGAVVDGKSFEFPLASGATNRDYIQMRVANGVPAQQAVQELQRYHQRFKDGQLRPGYKWAPGKGPGAGPGQPTPAPGPPGPGQPATAPGTGQPAPGQPTGAARPKPEVKTWKASWLQQSRIAGPQVAGEALRALSAEHREQFGATSPVYSGIAKILNDPEQVEKISNWIRFGGKYGGARLKDNKELMKGIYAALSSKEAGQAMRSETGARIVPGQGQGRNPGYSERSQKLIAESVAAKKRAEKAVAFIGKRREMIAGVIEATVKWSRRADPNGPVHPGNIPSPTKEEFIRLVESREVQAGDVLITPPEIEKGVRRSDPGFVVVTQQAIDDRHKSHEQLQQEKDQKAFEAKMDPRSRKLKTWEKRFDEGGVPKKARVKKLRELRKLAVELESAMLFKAAKGELSPHERASWDYAKEFLKKFPFEK